MNLGGNMNFWLFMGLLTFSALANEPVDPFNKYADKTYRNHKNTITYHLIRSPYGVDWSHKTSNVILKLAMNKYFFPETKRNLGHVTIELNCQNEDGYEYRIITGQGAKSTQRLVQALTKEGYGLTLLNRPTSHPNLPLITTEGNFETESDLIPEFNEYLKEEYVSRYLPGPKRNGRMREVLKKKHYNTMAFLTYKISPTQCQEMADFYKQYKQVTEQTRDTKSPKGGNVYGFGAEPTKFQGAGCATYAEAFFQVSGLGKYFNFYQTVHASKELVGDPKNGRRVTLQKLLSSGEKISKKEKDNITFKFPDPDLMHEYVQNINKTPNNFDNVLDYGNFGKKAKYAIIDLTSVETHL